MDAGIASLAATRRAKRNKTKQNKQANNPNKKLEKKIKNTWWKSNNAIKVFSL